MEIQMYKLVEEKETPNVPEIPTVIPVITTAVPSTLAEELESKVPLATVVPVMSSTTSTTESSTTTSHAIDEARKLVKAMEEMSLQTSEINRLKNMVDNLENSNKLAQINAKTHEKISIRLNEELKKLHKELSLKEHISYVKNHLWNKIIEAINDVWP